MFTPRKLHRRLQQKEKLYRALREMHADGVRICLGRPAASEMIRRHAERRTFNAKTARSQPIRIDHDENRGVDPYNTSK